MGCPNKIITTMPLVSVLIRSLPPDLAVSFWGTIEWYGLASLPPIAADEQCTVTVRDFELCDSWAGRLAVSLCEGRGKTLDHGKIRSQEG